MQTTIETTEHTPGPWQLTRQHDREGGIPISYGGYRVATAHLRSGAARGDNAEQDANGRLIAVAPELLTLLKRAVEVMDADGIIYGDCDDEPLDVLSAAREAIARAEGK